MVTSRDVARVAGVSQATVSRVINGQPHVRPEVEERVRSALASTGYVLNTTAKAMRTAKAGAIGLVTSDIRNPFFPYLLDELTKAAIERGVKALVWDDATADGRHAIEGLSAGAVDGLILTSTRIGSTDIDELLRREAKFVLCNRAPEHVAADVVMADHAGMVRAATEYLIGAGRRRFAVIYGAAEAVSTPLRRRGFEETLARHDIPLNPALIREAETSYESGVAMMVDLLDRDLGSFDTVVCTSDVVAYGALDALAGRGIDVPGEMWVTGIDGLPMSSWRSFDLTTVQQDVPAMAARAVERLLARIDGVATGPEVDLIPATLTIRGSTAHHGLV